METRGGVNEVGVAETGVHELPDQSERSESEVREEGTSDEACFKPDLVLVL